ncbi:hypothetical protein Kisp01_67360 [Kineosporia sp. NBRC 101677]|uniref:hypothetical protein n=1 Tax=Kineosporia sp. NBRC 101677 TaxID=3032197 RepID=UPI0024A2C6E3|nr:hypothetical protein [Kineosporia sp. NBRC 101677]GLY19722.1 hypothetical protein Kisp01_67360 [Kineosporia sp. NBRC 101677]
MATDVIYRAFDAGAQGVNAAKNLGSQAFTMASSVTGLIPWKSRRDGDQGE